MERRERWGEEERGKEVDGRDGKEAEWMNQEEAGEMGRDGERIIFE